MTRGWLPTAVATFGLVICGLIPGVALATGCDSEEATVVVHCPPPPATPLPDAPDKVHAGLAWKVITREDLGPASVAVPIPDCGDCVQYQFTQECTNPKGAPAPLKGAPAVPKCGCPVGQAKWTMTTTYHRADMFGATSTFCAPIGDPPLNVETEVRRNLDYLQANSVLAAISPANASLPVTMPVYVRVVDIPAQPHTTVPVPTYTLTMTLHSPHFVWYFDDDTYLPETTDLGANYPTGTLLHPFAHAGKHVVSLRVLWAVHYEFSQPFLPPGVKEVGEFPEYVRQINDAKFPLNVVEAHAVLVG